MLQRDLIENCSLQVEEVCDIIASKAELQGGYNGVGLSQGVLYASVKDSAFHTALRMFQLSVHAKLHLFLYPSNHISQIWAFSQEVCFCVELWRDVSIQAHK